MQSTPPGACIRRSLDLSVRRLHSDVGTVLPKVQAVSALEGKPVSLPSSVALESSSLCHDMSRPLCAVLKHLLSPPLVPQALRQGCCIHKVATGGPNGNLGSRECEETSGTRRVDRHLPWGCSHLAHHPVRPHSQERCTITCLLHLPLQSNFPNLALWMITLSIKLILS